MTNTTILMNIIHILTLGVTKIISLLLRANQAKGLERMNKIELCKLQAIENLKTKNANDQDIYYCQQKYDKVSKIAIANGSNYVIQLHWLNKKYDVDFPLNIQKQYITGKDIKE